MLKVRVSVKSGAFKGDPDLLLNAFTKKNMPKLYRYIEVATKAALKDKQNLPRNYGKISFYDDDRELTGKTGAHLVTQYQTRTETTGDGENLVVSNKKTVKGGWNVFWMLNEGTGFYSSAPKFMRFFDRYGNLSGAGPGFRSVQFRRGNMQFVPKFNSYIEKCVDIGMDNAVQTWDMSGAAESEFAKVLKRAGFKVELS
jgi:hypothetical protein